MAPVERPEQDAQAVPERLVTIPEAARVLAVPESWLREKVRLRKVPHRRLGKHVRFSSQDLERIVEGAAQQVVIRQRERRRWPHSR
ncbi:excisionase family DNA binding protein [Nocardiopsis sp. Huas11]|uniref:helix-turn-helix domain-containing protein n=1 Tax=Nocardiopsis sp. Huas11 TaxID=2183912 RepID=UPI000EAB823B|nr:helix-turn-helix domain-containing protein [Nocardiopsis sp. Huas11]RKS07056.1 excisionase family DNA binding protein [Nocardiopsis sp. Huas11]